ncbi:Ferredoxin [Methanosarcina barkeri str. Wiesmoor]|uniref:Ferredoxin n=2 Tax=Methanosarcina barkeri TaxID=2208 RepID=A0A0E3QQL7_METBA|nr:DUF362 domain-containing protein [Methanosarcina barkeri]AKB52568.1 Ferredoxin [Methanosarcina barkeri str. Wiesmoor]
MSKVAVLKTHPSTITDDYSKLMRLAEYEKIVPKQNKTVLKINLSWSLYYPACSTPPWQLEGVLKTLRNDGYKNVVGVENQTVVTHPWKGSYLNKWLPVLKKYDTEFKPLTNVKWTPYNPKSEMLAMYDIFDEIIVPEAFIESNVIHLPTVKTHGHTTTTGSMKNAFGGLIPKRRHHAHIKIHEVLVDLLSIQKEIHKGIFAVMDGTVCGNGAGPRTMIPYIGNLILASDDQVAIDAVAAKMMGFDPLNINYIHMAHERGLGMGDTDQIEIVGLEKSEYNKINFGFEVQKSPVVKWDQRIRKGTSNIKWLHSLLFHSPIFRTFIFASETYHDKLWYPTTGKKNIETFMKTEWGKLFESYEYGDYPKYTEVKEWNPY